MSINLHHINSSNAIGSVVVESVESALTFDISDVGPKFDWPRELTVRGKNPPWTSFVNMLAIFRTRSNA